MSGQARAGNGVSPWREARRDRGRSERRDGASARTRGSHPGRRGRRHRGRNDCTGSYSTASPACLRSTRSDKAARTFASCKPPFASRSTAVAASKSAIRCSSSNIIGSTSLMRQRRPKSELGSTTREGCSPTRPPKSTPWSGRNDGYDRPARHYHSRKCQTRLPPRPNASPTPSDERKPS